MIFRRKKKQKNPLDIQVTRKGFKVSYFQDIFHLVLASSWFEFFIATTVLYLCMNSFFASLYLIGGSNIINGDPHSFWDAFVFSFQTSATIGYGYLRPATHYADILVILDTLSGIVFVAITTALAFAKLSIPTARVEFTRSCVIHQYEGKQTLMFRVANSRDSQIADASIEAFVILSKRSEEGVRMERIYNLELVRSKSPVLFMSWTVMHIIDEESPLYGATEKELIDGNLRLVVSLTGIDDWSSQYIHASFSYKKEDIVRNKKFADILISTSEGEITLDYERFNLLEDFH